jgi:hypothetical protein
MNLLESSDSGLNLEILSRTDFDVDNRFGVCSSAVLDT